MEFPELGANCTKKDCKQLDFLPAQCSHCSAVFCSDHLSPFVHDCQQFRNNVLSDGELEGREKERWQVKCSLDQCKVKDLLPMKCNHCGLHFCLSHRHADQHQCAVFLPQEEEKAALLKKALQTTQSGQQLQAKVKAEINNRLEEAKSAGGAKGAMATKLALMKLKGRAKGEASVPTKDRIFFSVTCPNKEQNPLPLDVWMARGWSWGRGIDFMARQARIKNRNNVMDAPKLHFFKDDLCLSMPSDKNIEQSVQEELICDGEAIQFKLIPP